MLQIAFVLPYFCNCGLVINDGDRHARDFPELQRVVDYVVERFTESFLSAHGAT